MQRQDRDEIGMSFPTSLFTQNARSRLRFHENMKQKSLQAFLTLALVSLRILVVAMKTSQAVVVVIVMKTQ